MVNFVIEHFDVSFTSHGLHRFLGTPGRPADGKNSAGSGRLRTVARTPRGGVVGRVLGLVLGEGPHPRRRRVLVLEARRLLVLVDEALDEAAKLVEE